ncbi:MAG: MarR family transcriptional regulator [Acidimicrobiales bacterium]
MITDTSKSSGTRWLDANEQRAWLNYRRMRQLLDLRLARDLDRDSGLSEPDYDVLSTLTERAGARWRIGDLASRLLWSTSRLAHHLGRMEGRGLVARAPCADDGRGALVALTATGRSVLEQAAPLHVTSVREHFIDLLSEDELACLARVGERVISHLGPAPEQPTERGD